MQFMLHFFYLIGEIRRFESLPDRKAYRSPQSVVPSSPVFVASDDSWKGIPLDHHDSCSAGVENRPSHLGLKGIGLEQEEKLPHVCLGVLRP